MKATYVCDHCSFTTSDLEEMKKHEAAHADAETLANRINGLIAEYNSKHDGAFYIAKYTPNYKNRDSAKETPSKPSKSAAKKPPVGEHPARSSKSPYADLDTLLAALVALGRM